MFISNYFKGFKCFKKRKKKERKSINQSYPHSWIGRLNIAKISILTKETHRFSAIPTRSLNNAWNNTENAIFKAHRKSQETWRKQRWRRRKKSGISNHPDFRTHCNETVTKQCRAGVNWDLVKQSLTRLCSTNGGNSRYSHTGCEARHRQELTQK